MPEIVIDLRDGGDWSLDLCFAGLRKNLGADNVWDIPWKKKHREWNAVINGEVNPDWGMERRTLGYHLDDDSRPDSVIKGDWRSLGVSRVWLDERMESFQKYRELGLYDMKIPVVVVAGHDRFWNQSPSFVASLYGDRLQGMLLDNWYDEYVNLPFKTRRIGWSTNFDHYWTRPSEKPNKHIDIMFVGYNSHPDRARFIDHIEKRWGHLRNHIYLERQPNTFDGFVPKNVLFNIMQQSKICLNLRGAADRGKTLRAYEIPYVGSFMLSQEIDDPGMKEDFNQDTECDYFRDEHDLDEAIEFALEEETWRERVADAAHARAIGPLSVKERWAEVLRWIDDK